MRNVMSWIKVTVVNITMIIGIFVLLEFGASTVYFHKYASAAHGSSLIWLIDAVARKIDKKIAMAEERKRFDADQVLMNPQNTIEEQFAKFLFNEYENEFAKLVSNLKKDNTPLLILWLPTNTHEEVNRFYNQYFETISSRYGVEFLSGMKLLNEPREHIFLEPYNGHLTRYANLLIADQLTLKINAQQFERKKSFVCEDIQGMWEANTKEIWPIIPEVPYLLTTDDFGFRSSLPHEKKFNHASTILIAGDSFTFGPYLSSYDTYPAHLDRKLETFSIINGGVSSFSIRSERALIEKNLKCVNPTLVILQVLDNDISGMAVAKYNEYNFKGEVLDVPAVEQLFYDSIR